VKARPEDVAAVRANLGRRAAESRRSLGLTQEAFAPHTGWDVKYIQKIEQGRANLTLDSLVHLAAMLGVGLPTLFVAPKEEGPVKVGRPPMKPTARRKK
jgi:transcriptional regulator with XRE-family HTH domain